MVPIFLFAISECLFEAAEGAKRFVQLRVATKNKPPPRPQVRHTSVSAPGARAHSEPVPSCLPHPLRSLVSLILPSCRLAVLPVCLPRADVPSDARFLRKPAKNQREAITDNTALILEDLLSFQCSHRRHRALRCIDRIRKQHVKCIFLTSNITAADVHSIATHWFEHLTRPRSKNLVGMPSEYHPFHKPSINHCNRTEKVDD